MHAVTREFKWGHQSEQLVFTPIRANVNYHVFRCNSWSVDIWKFREDVNFQHFNIPKASKSEITSYSFDCNVVGILNSGKKRLVAIFRSKLENFPSQTWSQWWIFQRQRGWYLAHSSAQRNIYVSLGIIFIVVVIVYGNDCFHLVLSHGIAQTSLRFEGLWGCVDQYHLSFSLGQGVLDLRIVRRARLYYVFIFIRSTSSEAT